MPWTPLSARLNTLPLVLAGPIVRRTQPDAVTVWLALKEPRTVTLRIYSRDTGGNLREQCVGTRATIRLGDRLHLIAVTARPTATALNWGERYFYNLFFSATSTAIVPESADNLKTNGILAPLGQNDTDLNRLVYPGQPLPSFVLPPTDLNRLRIFHGSCRKPHGGGREALSILDSVLAESITDLNHHPQQLFLTGDQIYADDVAGPLLAALTQSGNDLLVGNKEEVLPVLNLPASKVLPSRRQDVILKQAKMSSDAAASHLLALGEFAAMYLFAWSSWVWPQDLPTAQEVFATEYAAWQARVQNWIATEGTLDRPRKAKPAYPQALFKFDQQVKLLEEYRKTLGQVRRALANISTYMIFDDHEVTDDWYLTGEWCRDVLRNDLGRRIIRNGLLTYALFQAWGNDPDQFEKGSGKELLQTIDTWRGDETGPAAQAIAQSLGLPDSSFSGVGDLPRPTGGVNWSYTFTAPQYQVIVLDSRTRRTFPESQGFPGLLSSTAMQDQVKGSNKEVTLIIAPAPLLGLELLEQYVQRWSRPIVGSDNYDAEAWSLERVTYQNFLKAIAPFRRVVLLSGDVHYGFAAELEYWDRKRLPADQFTAKFVNFTSSALHNQETKTEAIHHAGYARLFRRLPLPTEFFAWDEYKGDLEDLDKRAFSVSRALRWWELLNIRLNLLKRQALMLPAEGWPEHTFDAFQPDRSYRMRYLIESRQVNRDTTAAQVIAQPGASGPLSRAATALKEMTVATNNHLGWFKQWGGGREIVGFSNIGEIRFNWATREVIQDLWWWADKKAPQPLPLTEYRASLEPPHPSTAPELP